MNKIDNDYMYNERMLDEEKAIDVHNILNKFLRRKNLFLYITIPLFFIVLIIQVSKPYTPVYRATFDIGVARESRVEGFFSTGRETPTTQIGTVTRRVIANLLSVNLAEKIVDTLDLHAYVKDGDHDIKIEINIKEDINTPIGPYRLKIFDKGFSISKNGEKLKEGKFRSIWTFDKGELEERDVSNEYLDMGAFELRITPLKKIPSGKTYELIIYPKSKIALALRNSLAIRVLEADKIEQEIGSSDVPFSGEGVSKELVTAKTLFPGMNLIGILRIDVHWGNPDDALKIAEVLSTQIIREDVSEKSQHFIQSKTFIDSQLTLYQKSLTVLEEEIKGFKESKKIADLGAKTHSLISQMSDLESRRNQLQIEDKMLRNMSEYLAAGESDVPLNFAATLVSDPVFQSFYSQLLTTEAELKGKLKEYSPGHPKVLETQAKLDGLKDQMKEEISKRISTINTEIASVSNQISMLQAKLDNVPEDEVRLARLERDRETAEKLYTFFAEKLEETRVEEAGVTTDLKIINPPLLYPGPVNARRPILVLMVSCVMALLAGCVAVYVVDYIDNTVKDPDTIKAKIGLPIFGSIPVLEDELEKDQKKKSDMKSRVLNIIEDVKSKIKKTTVEEPIKVLDENIHSAEVEAFRKLSVNLDFAGPDKKYQVIYMTSPGPEDGKTFISLNLAVALGMTGKVVILIDTDFRKKKGHLTDVSKLKKEDGLFDILKGEANLEDVITQFTPEKTKQVPDIKTASRRNNSRSAAYDQYANIDLLPIGNIPPNPFVFLASKKMRNLIDELKRNYYYVLIDGVPVLLFADATYLANFSDGVLLTARYGKTGFKELENAKNILLASKANIIGLILNGVSKTRGSYYYQYYQKYYSKYYKK